VTVFIDTAVIMYANGGDHPLRDPCARIMVGIGDSEVAAVTSVEVVQEILHRFISVRRPDAAIRIAELTMEVFAPVFPITHAMMRRVPDLARRYPTLQARDLVHVATCIHEGITEIVSPDTAFDAVREIRRRDPVEFAASLGPVA
jgi:predicted nucleic acid-binding protein